MPVDGVVPQSPRSTNRYRRLAPSLQRGEAAFQPELSHAQPVRAQHRAIYQPHRPEPPVKSGLKFPGRSATLDDLDGVIDAFDNAGVERMPAARQDPVQIGLG